jgi:hypothetical protein
LTISPAAAKSAGTFVSPPHHRPASMIADGRLAVTEGRSVDEDVLIGGEAGEDSTSLE